MSHTNSKSLLDVFTEHVTVKFTKQLARKLYEFQIAYINKTDDHMAFFGGNLTGVHILRFTDKDFDAFFKMFGVNPKQIEHDLRYVSAIIPEYKISSDVFNLLCAYVTHCFMASTDLDDKTKTQAALNAMLVFNYRSISAIITDRFRYPADPRLAQKAYERLSDRYLIKKLGTWQAVMEYRAESIISKESIHYETLRSFSNDLGVVYMLNDSQGRLSDAIKNIYAEFMLAHKENDRVIQGRSSGIDMEGEEVFLDKTVGHETYVDYLLSILPEEHGLIKQDLIDLVIGCMPTTPKGLLETALKWMSDNLFTEHKKDIEEFSSKTIIYCLNYIHEDRDLVKKQNDLGLLLTRLRGSFMSSRSTHDDLMDLRVMGSAIVTEAINRSNEQMVSSVRTSVMLYLFIRSFTKKYYINK